jgi:hypothetical protein
VSRSLFRGGLAVAFAALTLLAGCNREPASTSLDSAAQQRAAAQIAHPAWLRERLPEHTVAYLRIPSFWGWLSAPNGRGLDAALASEPHTRVIASLREAIRTDKAIADSGFAPALTLLLADLAAPVEIAVVDGSDIANPASNVFASVRFNVADVAAMNARIAALATSTPLLKAPLDASGHGELAEKGYVYFDAANQRLFLLGGMAASAPALDALVQQTTQTRMAAMAASERELDASGQGLFFWMQLKGVNGMASAWMPRDPSSALLRDFVQKSESIAAGWGTVDGHGHLQLQLGAPGARLLGYIASDQPLPALKTAGPPYWAAGLRLPDAGQWQNLIDQLDTDFGVGTRAAFDKAKAEIGTKLGVDPVNLLRLIGPGVVSFEDAAGTYTAVQVTDRAALYAQLDELGKRHGWQHLTGTSGSASVHHLQIPGLSFDKADAAHSALATLYARMGTHLYWQEDGDWLVFGSVPQALADRVAAALGNDLATWQKAQGYDATHSLLGASAVTRNAQRSTYYAYLGGLQMAADASGATIDLMQLPSASALKLPVEGATGIAIEATRERLGLSLQYDATPLDALSGGGSTMTAVAVAGILAAVALPAYQDYTVRAQVNSVLAAAAMLERAIGEGYLADGTFPESLEDADFGEADKYLGGYWIEDGAIVLQFGDEAATRLQDQTLVLRPHRLGDELVWQCGDGAVGDDATPLSEPETATTVPTQLLPAHCR